jgi:hypothetical protein
MVLRAGTRALGELVAVVAVAVLIITYIGIDLSGLRGLENVLHTGLNLP